MSADLGEQPADAHSLCQERRSEGAPEAGARSRERRVDAEFFPDGQWKSNFLVNLGYGDPAGLFLRSPRSSFDEACRIE